MAWNGKKALWTCISQASQYSLWTYNIIYYVVIINTHVQKINHMKIQVAWIFYFFFKKNPGVSTPRAWSGPGHPLQ